MPLGKFKAWFLSLARKLSIFGRGTEMNSAADIRKMAEAGHVTDQDVLIYAQERR